MRAWWNGKSASAIFLRSRFIQSGSKDGINLKDMMPGLFGGRTSSARCAWMGHGRLRRGAGQAHARINGARGAERIEYRAASPDEIDKSTEAKAATAPRLARRGQRTCCRSSKHDGQHQNGDGAHRSLLSRRWRVHVYSVGLDPRTARRFPIRVELHHSPSMIPRILRAEDALLKQYKA